MMQAVESYLAVRHAAGFDLANADYLLRSFARFAAERNETNVRATTAISWASQSSSLAQRDERLKTVCRFARYMRAEDNRHARSAGRPLWLPQDPPRTSYLLQRRNQVLDRRRPAARAAGRVATTNVRHSDCAAGCHWSADLRSVIPAVL